MSGAESLSSLFGIPSHVSVERALAEFRSGRPVAVSDSGATIIVFGVEAVDAGNADALDHFAQGSGRLVLTAARLRRLGRDQRQSPGSFAFPHVDATRIQMLSIGMDVSLDAPVAPVSALDAAALELAALALTLPGVFIVPVKSAPEGVVAVEAAAINRFRAEAATGLSIVSRAPVPLEQAPRSEFVVFRGGEGMRDQVAIVVGTPDVNRPVAVRMHSACLTGDLFGSLKCDCGDQLRDTVRQMAANDGGILLYLDQEGRGNGIANKMRAYKLQSQGWDTYDADEALGFDLDQRHFDFAADMLRQLGVTSVRLMTNNPVKIEALRVAGLDVVSDERVLGRPTEENVRYLQSKRDRAGHFIDFEKVAALASQQL
ncbi:MAG: GTP cyclohydrolase II RibA [Proteobacteria bacterium]|nr:GTP cyclohydrolase II RibA [Pseudomonadota bacterium]